MKTFKLLYVCLFILFSTALVAQKTGTTFAVLGGVNLQTFNGKNLIGTKLSNDMITGFHIGANAQIPIVPEFYFQPGLMFSTKGYKNTENNITNNLNISYIEVPLNFVYKGALGNGFIFIGLGPYIGYGVAGKSSPEPNVKFTNVVEVTDPITDVYVKPFDAGANILVGYEMASGLFLQLNSQLGLIGIYPENRLNPSDATVWKNTGFGLSLGYRF
jgi:hypothetical protein